MRQSSSGEPYVVNYCLVGSKNLDTLYKYCEPVRPRLEVKELDIPKHSSRTWLPRLREHVWHRLGDLCVTF